MILHLGLHLSSQPKGGEQYTYERSYAMLMLFFLMIHTFFKSFHLVEPCYWAMGKAVRI
jgi:hypothetical protein